MDWAVSTAKGAMNAQDIFEQILAIFFHVGRMQIETCCSLPHLLVRAVFFSFALPTTLIS